jgi:hypothetical protein
MDFRLTESAANLAGTARQAPPIAARQDARRDADGRRSATSPLACPRLGLARDPLTHALFPTPDHRCFAERTRRPELAYQARFCLAGRHPDCDEYRRYEARCVSRGLRGRLSRLRVRLPLGLRLLMRSVGLAVSGAVVWIGLIHAGLVLPWT